MSSVGQIEKKTQAHVVRLFREQLGYDYLGDWTEREGNRNIEEELLKEISYRLSAEFGRGFSWQNLYSMRNFYLTYRGNEERILQTASGKSGGFARTRRTRLNLTLALSSTANSSSGESGMWQSG
jgi:hypothetical protein